MSAIDVQEKPAVRHVNGSVDLSIGNLQCDGDLLVDDNILDGREVRAGGSVHVVGVIQAAVVHAGGDLRADGGISGRDKADCRAGGMIQSRYIVKARAHAAGDIEVETEVLNSHVVAGGNISIERGALVGGRISAMGTVRCGKLGSNNSRTLIEAGVDSSAEQMALTAMAEIESRRRRAAKIRQTVAPLLDHQKSLTPLQKERATELLYEADSLGADAARILAELRGRCKLTGSQPDPQIHVTQTAYAGVNIRLGDVQAVLETSLAGPLSIVTRGAGADKRIVIVDAAGGAVDLATCPVTSDGVLILRKLRTA